MPNGIDVGDALPTLQQGVAGARADFDTMGGNKPADLPPAKPAPPLNRSRSGPPVARGIPLGDPSPELAAADSGVGDQLPYDASQAAPPPKPALAAAEDNGDMWSPSTLHHFLRDTFKGAGAELKDVVPRTLYHFGSFLSKAGQGLSGDELSGTPGDAKAAGAITEYLDKAVENWTPPRAEQTGQGEGSGGAAAALGSGLEAVPFMLAGPAGVPAMIGEAATDSYANEIKQGHDAGTAVANATVDGIASWLQMKWGVVPTLPILRRVLTAIGAGDAVKVVGDITKKLILKVNGYDKDAAKINVQQTLDELPEATVQNAVFGALGGHKPAEKGKVPEPAPAAAEPVRTSPSATEPTKEGVGLATAVPASAVPAPAPAPTSAVPDQPSAESSKDLRAQIRDMNDKATPRTGVLVTSDSQKILAGSKDANAASVQGTLGQARTQGRTIDLPQGTLILKNKKAAEAATARLKAGEDPQAVIGSVTGAGDGKTPDMTAVVQGHDPAGNVVTETAVKPADIPQATQAVVDQGKTPVVTTPEAAVQRRIDKISEERNAPAQMGIMKTPFGKEVAVHVEPGAAEGHVRVRALDADGEPSNHTVDVPADRVKVSTPKTVEKATEGISEPQSPAPAPVEAKPKADETPTGPEIQAPPQAREDISLPPGERQDMTKTKEERAAERARVAAERAKEEGHSGELEPEPIPAKAAEREGVHKQRDEETDEQYAARIAAKDETAKPVTTEPAKEVETPPAPKVLKAKRPVSGMDALKGALEAHEAQESIPPGSKFAAPLAIRQRNAGDFAAVLKAAADSASGKASPTDIERAQKAAKAVGGIATEDRNGNIITKEGVATKGAADTAKGRGTGHVKITALVGEMHKAARSLLGETRSGDGETVAPKAAELKAKIEKTKAKLTAKPKEPKGDAEETFAQKRARLKALSPEERSAHVAQSRYDGQMEKIYGNDFSEKELREEIEKYEGADKARALDWLSRRKFEVPVNPKYAADIKVPKPKVKEAAPANHDQKKIKQISDKYIWAENGDDAKAARGEVEQFLHEHFADQMSAEDRDNVLHLLDQRRVNENPDSERPRRMSDTLEDEDVHLDPTDKYEGMQRGGKELLGGKNLLNLAKSAVQRVRDTVTDNKMKAQWNRLGSMAHMYGMLGKMEKTIDTGQHTGTHQFLDQLLGMTTDPELHGMIKSLREHAPDMPIYMVSKITNLKTGLPMEHAAGLFSGNHESIQGTFSKSPEFTLRTLVHEIRHAATAYELRENPTGRLAIESNEARAMLIARLKAKYGEAAIQSHLDYFRDPNANPKPANYMRDIYGIHNILEMHAELDNPQFVKEIATSEDHAQPGENIPKGSGGLLSRIYSSIAKFFGVGNARLLEHIGSLHEETMATQASESYKGGRYDFLNGRTADDRARDMAENLTRSLGANPLEARKAADSFATLRETPKDTKADRTLAEAVGEHLSLKDDDRPLSLTAKLFDHAVKSSAVGSIRKLVTRLKSVDQIFRDHRADFGHADDKANPLNQLEDVQTTKNILMHKMHEITRPVSEDWLKLPEDVNKKLGQLFIDVTSYKIDPRKEVDNQIIEVKDDKKALARHAEYVQRLKALPADAQQVFGAALEANKRVMRELRKAGVDAALHTFSDSQISDAQRALLYGAKTHEVFDQLVGPGKLIDVGDSNDSLRNALASFAGQAEIQGPYMHLGRTGDFVVTAKPEGTREFGSKSEADAFANNIVNLSPGSKATYQERAGKHIVDYKADYTSFHESKNEAEQAAREMTKMGLDVGNVTQKTLSKSDVPLSSGATQLLAEAERKITKNGSDEGTKALTDSLRSAFLQLSAARSAYAGSKLARKASAGVKPEEMRKNFADYAQSTIWHAAQMRTVFDQASALAKVRGMARDSDPNISQATTYRRGEVVSALNEHMQDEVQHFGHKSPFNSMLAKLGFMSYLASPSHAFIWMTQNFSTGIPVAGARWGYAKSTASFMSAMKAVSAPAFRETLASAFKRGGNSTDVHNAIIAAVKAHPKWGKWAEGENSPLQQLIDRGVINHSYSEAMGALARGDSAAVARAFEFARLLPNMADAFNRVSTALAGLELTGGDIRKTADFVREIHADYSQQSKPLLFKQISRVPGGNSVMMFKTYVQAMAHLLYGNIKDSFASDRKLEAAKTVAGMMVGTAIFAGVFKAAALEPIRLGVYAYHKIFDQEGEAYDLQNSVNKWLVDAMGEGAGRLAAFGLPHAAGFDLSSRMGLSDLFFHEMPDLLSPNISNWKDFAWSESGTMTSFLGQHVADFTAHMQKGEPFQAISSAIPIKQYQDAVKAYGLATTGKMNSIGSQMTDPSLRDAAWQLFGLKPASVAEAGEHGRVAFEYSSAVKESRASIIKSYVSGDARDALARVNEFNRLHPAEKIKGQDLLREKILQQRVERGMPGRDAELNDRQRF